MAADYTSFLADRFACRSLSDRLKLAMQAVILTIAGSDSGGGAGVQADLKTISALGGFTLTVITALTAQNLSRVSAIEAASARFVREQLEAVFGGFPIKAAKCGMLLNREIIKTIADFFRSLPEKIPLVVDPVFAATSGSKLIADDAIQTLQSELFPLAKLITPNLPEAEILCGFAVDSLENMRRAAKFLVEKFNTNILVKGGHLKNSAADLLCESERKSETIFEGEKIADVNTHGSGCTYAAAIATFLGQGMELLQAVSSAKEYLSAALANPLSVGNEKLINHFWRRVNGEGKSSTKRVSVKH